MIRRIASAIIACFISLGLNAHDGTRIGVIDVAYIAEESDRGKAFMKKQQSKAKETRGEFKKLAAKRQKKAEYLKQNSASISADKRQAVQREIQDLDTQIQRMGEDKKRDFSKTMRKALLNFEAELLPLIKQVAEEKNLQLVFSEDAERQMIYVDSAIDISDEVMAKFDANK